MTWCSIPESGRCAGEGNGNSFQYSFLGNPMDKGTRWATVHGIAESRTLLRTHTHWRFRLSSFLGLVYPHAYTQANNRVKI